jgi:oxygen-independent coproporphyrinogen-3 oxidase
MAFGVYIHIPYCLQVCPYCDFTKYEMGTIMPPARYVELLAKEIQVRASDVITGAKTKDLSTIYFGGGTPSLLEPSLILSILDELAKAGFRRRTSSDDLTDGPTEMTIEIDPATVDQSRLEAYLELGFNRFSVGAQTFNSRLLQIAGRKHSAQDTVNLLTLLKRNKVNYSFDLLFALPTQTLEELRADVATALSFEPAHLSAYCLTVPENHPMAKGRAPDEEQVEMFNLIESELAKAGVLRYEISNFAKPGMESKHNLLYWTDQPYWGIGTGAHSYFPSKEPWGLRFWNAPSIKLYEREILSLTEHIPWEFASRLPENQKEALARHQSLTDFCHTSLRLTRGLERNALRLKFNTKVETAVAALFDELIKEGLTSPTANGWSLTAKGRVLSNTVFGRLTFLEEELAQIDGK